MGEKVVIRRRYSIMMTFQKQRCKDGKVLYVNSHDSVYKGISREIGYLGGGIIRTYTNFKSKSNGDLKEVLTVLSKDFEDTKSMLVKLTHHLDSTESLYNNILKEYKKRGN